MMMEDDDDDAGGVAVRWAILAGEKVFMPQTLDRLRRGVESTREGQGPPLLLLFDDELGGLLCLATGTACILIYYWITFFRCVLICVKKEIDKNTFRVLISVILKICQRNLKKMVTAVNLEQNF